MTAPPTCILTDIEGTTTAIAFVKDTLFPFAQTALDGFLDAHGTDPAVAAVLTEVRVAAPDEDPRAALRRCFAPPCCGSRAGRVRAKGRSSRASATCR